MACVFFFSRSVSTLTSGVLHHDDDSSCPCCSASLVVLPLSSTLVVSLEMVCPFIPETRVRIGQVQRARRRQIGMRFCL